MENKTLQVQYVEGYFNLNIIDYADQLVHEVSLDFVDISGVLRARAKLAVQWIHSKALYLKKLMEDTEAKINMQKVDIKDYQE